MPLSESDIKRMVADFKARLQDLSQRNGIELDDFVAIHTHNQCISIMGVRIKKK